MSRSVSASPTADYPPLAVSWYATIVLGFLYWMSLLDRFIISMLIDPIKSDLGLSDVQFGVLQGLAFIISFTLFGFVFGALADRRDRRRLIFIGVTLWSVASTACGLAQNFWHLLIARAGLGAGESSLNPSATSMISDLFPRDRLTFAMAVYSLGATIGSGTALMLGGAIIYWVTSLGEVVLPVLGPVSHWQLVFFIVGLPGFLFAFLVFSFPEPARRGRKDSAGAESRNWLQPYRNLFHFVRGHLRFFLAHYTGFTITAGVVAGCVGWYPVHLMRAHAWNEGQVGAYLGMSLLVSGIIGKFLGGLSVDAMYRRGYRDAQLRWFGGCLLVAGPLGVLAAVSGSPWMFLALIGAFTAILTSLQACAMSSLNLVTPNHLRGAGVAFYSTVAGLLGGSLGSVLVPVFSGYFSDPATAIGYGMATLMAIGCPLAAVALFAGMPGMRRAIAEQEESGLD
ncbi:MFS transporter [Haliea sp. E17]|uniref:MFS transporter n=1 Tax=Haliea sp. E17 TaxID=3401576 RepID=UPI003AB044D1